MTKELFEEYRSDTGKGVYDSDHNDMIEWLEKKLIEARKELSKLRQDAVSGRSEQLVCPHCGSDDVYGNVYDEKKYGCFNCDKLWEN